MSNENDLVGSLARYQALVVGGLCFIVLFSISIMGVMLYLSYSLGNQSARLESVATETHNTLCALFDQNLTANREARLLLRATPEGLVNDNGSVIISASLIQRGIDQRQETIDAMKTAGLSCA